MNSYTIAPLVRDDVTVDQVITAEDTPAAPVRRARAWALTGLLAGVVGPAAGMVIDRVGNPVYDPALGDNPSAVRTALVAMGTELTVFHVLMTSASLLMIMFAAGLHRRLRNALPDHSLLPPIAAGGLLITAVMMLMGTANDTELIWSLAHGGLDAGTATFYAHWISTVPLVWTGAGLTALVVAMASLARRALPRWIGVVSALLGLITVAIGLSPLQYMSEMPAALWLIILSVGLVVGDKAHRQGR